MISQFVGNLSSTVEVGHIFVFNGRTIDGASRLDINLKSGKHEEAAIPLHLSVRFHEDIIVRNTRDEEGEWGAEERDENLNELTVPNPILPGDSFKVYILVGDENFHISVNGRPYCTYGFRMGIADIRSVLINEDLQLITQVDHRTSFPSPYPMVQLDDPRITFSNDIPKCLTSGHVLILTAIPFGNPRGAFTIRFTEGESRKQALHINPRFDPHYVVIRNSMNDNLDFGREERDGGFPFVIDQQFKFAIAFTDNEFKFAINGNPFAAYQYRSANQLEKLNGMKIHVSNGLQLEITAVDHMNMGIADCDGFETYSDPDVQIL